MISLRGSFSIKLQTVREDVSCGFELEKCGIRGCRLGKGAYWVVASLIAVQPSVCVIFGSRMVGTCDGIRLHWGAV